MAVACINYRANSEFKFPVPLHDVLAGYERVLSLIASQQGSDKHPARIGVCGQLFGGTLATALALTECRKPRSGVVAAAVNNPIVDWTVHERLEEDLLKRKKTPSRAKMSSWELYKDSDLLPASRILTLRQLLFSTPDAYFDSFASPIHFFRSPAIDCPGDGTHRDRSLEQGMPSAPVVRRRARHVFPPASSDLVLPYIQITSGESSILHSQCAELMQRISDSHVRRHLSSPGINEGRRLPSDNDELSGVQSAVNQTHQTFSLNTVPGIGLWGVKDESSWKSDIKHVGHWFNDILG
jgi:acetyl esterase/lipase